MDLQDKLYELLSEKYGWSKSEMDKAESFEELGLDSLSLYSLVTECEEKFEIKIDTDDITQIDTPKKFINYATRCNRQG